MSGPFDPLRVHRPVHPPAERLAAGAAPLHTGSEARLTRRTWLQALAVGGCGLVSMPSRALAPPTGPVVLMVHGRVLRPNTGASVQFDMAMLEALPQVSFSTRTPWYAGPRRFTGPLMRDVLAAAGAQGTQLRLSALNDYRVDVPWEDAQRHDLLVARLIDGQPMAVRDKGPLFAIYPFDAQPELRTALYYSRSAWQLRAIEVA